MSGAPNAEPSPNAYPEQRHAGKVGYGPNYYVGASFGDIVTGLADEVKGKITHDPILIQHGHELISGEEKRKELLGEKGASHKKAADKDKKHKGSKLKESSTPSELSNSKSETQAVDNTAAASNVVPDAGDVHRSPGAQHSKPNQSHHAQTSKIAKHDPVH
ncbi:hypothetical protein BJ165DRAFT_1405256 [Panaeolus papilionaceus]|nr:hypothetical protein BJ165DRAFT_1405256 [Panaeolus papilionaceus]